jgi:hypothetical protein
MRRRVGKMETTNDLNNRKIYRKKENHENVIFNLFCFLCGFVLALVISAAVIL